MSDVKVESLENCRICSVPTANKCTSCKTVSYCSREHQKQDWKTHKDECKPFKVRSSLELGRFLEATRQISAGDVLLIESPIVFGPRPEEKVCLGCYDPSPQERCPRCSWPVCSLNCSGLTKPEHHGAECYILQLYARRVHFISDDFFRYEAILPLRCLLLQHRKPNHWKSLLEMEAHMKKRGPSTEAHRQAQENVVDYLEENFFKFLSLAEKESEKEVKLIPQRSSELLHKICGIINVNALEIRLNNGGYLNGLYSTACIMEHNCLPNTKHRFYSQPDKEFRIKVSANQDIQPGSHISTMYTHALWGTQQRQDHLRSTKHFTCRCKRCGDPSELGTNLSALICLAQGVDRSVCGGTQLPVAPLDSATEWKCDKCPTSLTSAQVFELVNMIGGEVDHVQEQRPTVQSLEILLGKLRKLLHRNHYHCYAVMHSLIQLYGRQQGYLPDQMNNSLVEKKIKMCKQLLAITRAIDPTSSRLYLYSSVIEQELASAILILAKRNIWTGPVLAENVREAKRCLEQARASLEGEELDSPEAKIAQVVATNVSDLEAFCRTSDLSL